MVSWEGGSVMLSLHVWCGRFATSTPNFRQIYAVALSNEVVSLSTSIYTSLPAEKQKTKKESIEEGEREILATNTVYDEGIIMERCWCRIIDTYKSNAYIVQR